MKLIPNIQKELDALMADPLNYQDPNGILASTRTDPRWAEHPFLLLDAFILVEVSDFEVADKVIAETIKTDRGRKLRNAYASVAEKLAEGVRQEKVIHTGNTPPRHKEYISAYFSLFLENLLDSINYRKSLHDKLFDEDVKDHFPDYGALKKLEEVLINPAAYYRGNARQYHSSSLRFKQALSNSGEYLQPFA